MKIWSSSEVVRELAQGSMGSWERAKYLIVLVAFFSLSTPIYLITPRFGPAIPLADRVLALLSTIIVLFLTVRGIRRCFLQNTEIDDQSFVERFIILAVPVTVQLTVVSLPIFLILAYVAILVTPAKTAQREMFGYMLRVLGPVGTYLYFYLISGSFERLRGAMKGSPNQAL